MTHTNLHGKQESEPIKKDILYTSTTITNKKVLKILPAPVIWNEYFVHKVKAFWKQISITFNSSCLMLNFVHNKLICVYKMLICENKIQITRC